MVKQNNEMELTSAENMTKEVTKAKEPRRRLNPVVKWVGIGVGAALVVGGITFLIVKGKKVPVEAVEKIAEVTAEVAAAA